MIASLSPTIFEFLNFIDEIPDILRKILLLDVNDEDMIVTDVATQI